MKTNRIWGGSALAMLAVLGLSAQSAWAQTLTLKVADSYPTGHYISAEGARPWMDRITELTNGDVQFQYFPASQIGTVADLPTLTRTGVTDIGLVASGVLAGDFPLASVCGVPLTAATAEEATNAFWSIIEKDGPLRQELTSKGLYPLSFFGLSQFEVFTRDKPVATPEDFKGLKLSAGGSMQQAIISALGASAVRVPTNEIYTAMERGTIDGVLLPYATAQGYKINEVAKHMTYGAALGSTCVGYAISQNRWDGLPENVREAITEASVGFRDRLSTFQDKSTSEARDFLVRGGISVTEISTEEAARWREAIAQVGEEWAAGLESRGLAGNAIREEWVNATRK